MNPILIALAISLAANGLLGWSWLHARDRAAVASTKLEDVRADVLVAGFLGSLVAIILLNTVPTVDDTWRGLGWRW